LKVLSPQLPADKRGVGLRKQFAAGRKTAAPDAPRSQIVGPGGGRAESAGTVAGERVRRSGEDWPGDPGQNSATRVRDWQWPGGGVCTWPCPGLFARQHRLCGTRRLAPRLVIRKSDAGCEKLEGNVDEAWRGARCPPRLQAYRERRGWVAYLSPEQATPARSGTSRPTCTRSGGAVRAAKGRRRCGEDGGGGVRAQIRTPHGRDRPTSSPRCAAAAGDGGDENAAPNTGGSLYATRRMYPTGADRGRLGVED